MRIAVLGNSHGACLRQAIVEGKFDTTSNGCSVDFFLTPRLALNGLIVANGNLVAKDQELIQLMQRVGCHQSVVEVATYDAFIIIGLQFKIEPLDPRFSAAVKDAAVRTQLRRSVLGKLAMNRLRPLTDKPILAAHQPMPACSVHEFRSPYPQVEDYDTLLGRYARVLAEKKVEVVAQPSSTRPDDVVTSKAYALGSRQLLDDAPHSADDILHMNADYGAIYWEHLFSRHLWQT